MNLKSKRIKSILHTAALEAAGLLYPLRCPICDAVMEPGVAICTECRGRIKIAEEPVCKRCGKPLESETIEYCGDCSRKKHIFKQGKAVFVYEGDIRKSMYRFKYGNKREYAAFYAKEAANLYSSFIEQHKIEVIVPIPMYRGKRRLRGYNQADVFAKTLGRELGLPVDYGLVKRIRNTIPQKELNDAERKDNLKNAFQLEADIVKYNQILLVDDIYTTGSTMDAVAKILLTAGVKDIYYICISIGSGY